MSAILLLIGAILAASAFRNTQGDLATALETDVPKFFHWAAAIGAIGAIGWIPGMKPISRWLLALVLVVIVLNNYTQIFSGFTTAAAAAPAPSQAAVTPDQQYAASVGAPGAGGINALAGQIPATALASFSPASFVQPFEAGVAHALIAGALVG